MPNIISSEVVGGKEGYTVVEDIWDTPPFKEDEFSGITTFYSVRSPRGGLVLDWACTKNEAEKGMDTYISMGGEEFESLGGLLGSGSYHQGYALDSEVRDLVTVLNERGYETTGSCAGHLGKEGYIVFRYRGETSEERKDIEDIITSMGFSFIRWREKGDVGSSKVAYFRGVG